MKGKEGIWVIVREGGVSRPIDYIPFDSVYINTCTLYKTHSNLLWLVVEYIHFVLPW